MEVLASPRSFASSPRLSDAEGTEAEGGMRVFESVYAVGSDGESDGRAEPEAEEPLSLLSSGLTTVKPVVGALGLTLEVDAGASMLWNLISPCSDEDEEDSSAQRFFPEDDKENGGDSGVEREGEETIDQALLPDDQSAVEDGSDGDDEAEDAQDSDSDEEVEVFNAESFWAAVERPPSGELAWWPDSDKEEEEDDSSRGHQSEELKDVPSDTVEPASVAVTTSAAVVTPIWGRLKARSYAGATSTSVQAAVASMKQRARTISSLATSSARHIEDDDGDFSSDDEDCQRKSDLHDLRASSQWQRRQSFAFAARLSVAAPSIDSLRSVRGKFGHKLHLFRSSSSNTVTSEESFLDSPNSSFGSAMAGEIKSAPASLHLGAGYSAGAKPSRLNSNSSSLHVPKNLHAGVSKAAGYLTAASAEAARKLKAKTTTLRAQRKPEASETEEEELDAASTAVLPSDFVVAVDRHVGA